MTDEEVFYVVQVMRKWSSLKVLGFELDAEAAAPGCIGFMPIFKDLASATSWQANQHHLNASVVAIMAGEESGV